MSRPKEVEIFHKGGVEYRVERKVHPTIVETVVKVVADEQRTLVSRAASALGKRISRVDIVSCREQNEDGTVTLGLQRNDRVMLFAGSYEAIARDMEGAGIDEARVLLADQNTTHELRHRTQEALPTFLKGGQDRRERDAMGYAESRTIQRRGARVVYEE